MRLDLRLVERVDDRGLRPLHRVERLLRAADDVHVRALAQERARHRAADIATAAVDHRGLVLE